MSATPYLWQMNVSEDEVGESKESPSYEGGVFQPLDPDFEKEFTQFWKPSMTSRAYKMVWYGVVNTITSIPDDAFIYKHFSLVESIALRKSGLMDLSISRFQADLSKGDGDKEEHGQSYDWDGANK